MRSSNYGDEPAVGLPRRDRIRRQDVCALLLLVVMVLVPMCPALLLRAPALQADALIETLPRFVAVARNVQAGAIPLWDSHIFAGAKPLYALNLGGACYPVLYPFFLLADTDQSARSALMLLLLPWMLHVFWASVGGYCFGRAGLRLTRAGAWTLGAVYGLSPAMTTNLATADTAYLFSYLPWVLLGLVRFMETGRCGWWVAGTICIALMSTVGSVNFLVRVYFVAATVVALHGLLSACRTGRGPAGPNDDGIQERRLRLDLRAGRLLAAVGMLALGAGLSGFVLLGELEGAQWMSGSFKMTADWAATVTKESSMPPLDALMLFLPNFFGLLDLHGWGIVLEEEVNIVSALGGGMFVMVAVLAALCWLPRRPADAREEEIRRWTWIGTLLLFGFLLTMMGRFTPVFGWLCALLPWFFRFPHPTYYQFAVCWAVALLAGIGVSSLVSVPVFRDRVARPALVLACMALALTGGTIALLRPTVLDSVTMASYKTLGVLHEWRWFLTGPVLHFIVASALLLAGFRLLPPRLRAGVLVAGSAVELLWQFSLMVYRAPLDRQERRPPDYRVICSYGRRFFSLADFLAPGLLPMLADATRDGQTRWAAMPLEWDNFAWAADSRALLGHSSRPLLPRLVNVMNRFLQDMPYSPRYGGDMSRLFNNMSVGYVLTPDPPNPAAPWNVMAKAKIVLSEIPKPLPYVHTQDRVIALGAEAQLDRFCTTDLRRAVYVEPEVAAAVPQSADPRGGDIPAEERERFERLQQTNRILRVDQSRPNRTVIEAEIAKPAMLVITECWHPGWRAEVDGRRVPLWQVNYLQQGLWLEAGRHSVRLSFFPRSLRCGAWVSAGSAVIVAAVALWGMLRRGLAGGGADCCGSPAGTPKRSAPFAPSVIDRLPEEARVGR